MEYLKRKVVEKIQELGEEAPSDLTMLATVLGVTVPASQRAVDDDASETPPDPPTES
jgi:hypothetical protein